MLRLYRPYRECCFCPFKPVKATVSEESHTANFRTVMLFACLICSCGCRSLLETSKCSAVLEIKIGDSSATSYVYRTTVIIARNRPLCPN